MATVQSRYRGHLGTPAATTSKDELLILGLMTFKHI